jgi:hypothetical protein
VGAPRTVGEEAVIILAMGRHEMGWREAFRRDVISPRVALTLIRRRPRILLSFLVTLIVTYGVTAAALSYLGHLHPITDWALYPGLVSAGIFGSQLDAERRRSRANH